MLLVVVAVSKEASTRQLVVSVVVEWVLDLSMSPVLHKNGFSFGSGGGGGAGAYPYPEARGGNGADGAVMVRYETGQVASTTGATASGGNVNGLEPGNGYKYHTFTSNGTLTFTQGGEIEVLIVAAGGSTSSSSACCVGHGGGGGGGILHGGYTIAESDLTQL